MGFRFCNTIRITPQNRADLGTTEVSLSAGQSSATVTIGEQGVHGNNELPRGGNNLPTPARALAARAAP